MTILFETHKTKCTCSYCGKGNIQARIHYGLNIPKNKKWNSWWVIKYWRGKYFRWTNTWLRRFKF